MKGLGMPAFAAIGVAAFMSPGQSPEAFANHDVQDAWEVSGHEGVKYLYMDGQATGIWHAVSGKLLRQGYDARRHRMSA